MPVTAIASTLPIRLNGRLAMTSQLLTRQWNETNRIIRIKTSAMLEYRASSVRVWASASAAPVNSMKTLGGSLTLRDIAR